MVGARYSDGMTDPTEPLRFERVVYRTGYVIGPDGSPRAFTAQEEARFERLLEASFTETQSKLEDGCDAGDRQAAV